jgi:sarcosine oxidase, subunit alpha
VVASARVPTLDPSAPRYFDQSVFAMSGYRLADVSAHEAVSIVFDGQVLTARRGESLAAALLANGLRIVARSFKYHRPRGIVGYGAHEPNALVGTPQGTTLATKLASVDGLVARSVNAWPSARFDVASLLDRFHALLPVGFYYKTFRGPGGRAWPLFEPMIRALAGLGVLPSEPTPLRIAKRFAHCDVLVVGGGVAGVAAAAAAAAASGLRIWLVDDGALTEDVEAQLRQCGVRILTRTVALGRYDGGLVVALERDACLWKIRARSIVLATGAVERPFVFANNDRPGVMLLSAAHAYARRDKVACGKKIVAMCNNDMAYATVLDLVAMGVSVRAIVDLRAAPDPALRRAVESLGVELHAGCAIVEALGSIVAGARIAPVVDPARTIDLVCDTIAMAGGWTPQVHLHSQAGGRLTFLPEQAAFVPSEPQDGVWSAGACNGRGNYDDAIADGAWAGAAAAGLRPMSAPIAPSAAGALLAQWEIPGGLGKAFVDFAADTTSADARLAVREGYDSVELLKRYTTTGMALDQGRLSNMNAIDILARARDVSPQQAGTTTFRPPYVPVPFAAIADPGGTLLKPSRTTSLTAIHVASGAVMYESGANWRRPGYYPRSGENLSQATRRECRAVRNAVGIYDSSPLGKFEIVGRDCAAFLDFVYATRLSDLKVGRGRYALQLHEDGRLFDDGIVFRMGPERFFVTTTTGNADSCLQRFEYCRQVLRPDLSVFVLPVTEQWADIVLCGPKARAVLAAADLVLPAEFPFMAIRDVEIAGRAALVARAGFTGELSFEFLVPSSYAPDLWRRLIEGGAKFGIEPVGSEANHVLRIEKGFISVGHEADGIADPGDLGLNFAIHADKSDFIGKQALLRNRADPASRPQLVGLLARDLNFELPEGAAILRPDAAIGRGYVTASCYSEALGRSVAMALLEDGRASIGSDVAVSVPGGIAGARVVAPVFYDPKGVRQRG